MYMHFSWMVSKKINCASGQEYQTEELPKGTSKCFQSPKKIRVLIFLIWLLTAYGANHSKISTEKIVHRKRSLIGHFVNKNPKLLMFLVTLCT